MRVLLFFFLVQSLGVRSQTQAPQSAVSAQASSAAGANSSGQGFVRRNGAQFQLDGKPYYFTGANFYSAMVNAAGGGMTRDQTTQIFQTMQSLGLTVLRTWAFNDYGVNNTWQALQTSPQVFDERVFRDGLDWIISEAPKYGVKLLLTLTNYQRGYGGAYQYVKWANRTSILDFYREPCVGWYQNNVRTIVTRQNSITGIAYRDDPAIFGWELINEPHVPGDDTGSILTNWINTNSQFLKSLDSNHLVGTGVEGFYGGSTPARLADNPSPSLTAFANGGNPAPYATICEGQDFAANHAPQGVDFTSIHLYPDYWATGNLSFQLAFTAQFVAGHLAESARLNKPLVIGEFGKYPPLAERNTYLRYIYGVVADSAAKGGALAGSLVWTLGTSPEFPYNSGYDAFGIYPTAAPYTQAPPTGYIPPTQTAGEAAANQEFYGWANQTACNDRYKNAPKSLLTNAPSASDGWNDTLSIIRENVAATALARQGNLAAAGPVSTLG